MGEDGTKRLLALLGKMRYSADSMIQMQRVMESCPAKTVLSGGMGFVLGGAFGLFMASVSLALTPYSASTATFWQYISYRPAS